MTLVVGGSGAPVRTAAPGNPPNPSGTPSTPSTPSTPTRPSAPSAAKAGDVQFSKIRYDSPGRDNGSSSSLNGEWVRLTNKTKHTVDLRLWTVRDASGHVYTFGSHALRAGKTVYLHTGRGTNGRPSSADRYWKRGSYIWNNGGDTATLRSNTGKKIDTCRYSGTRKGYTTC
jgi:hypothetical protein